MNIYFLFILSLGFFFLLMERKLLSLINFRLGPNKVFMTAMFQFLIDGFKLLIKEFNMELMNLKILNMLMFMLFLNLMFWLFFNFILLLMYFILILILILLMIMKLLILFFIIINFKNNYSYLGFMRIQLISYDIMIF